ncbi:MAG TPA: hypothetical protein VIW24_09925 [Aldersonia sp.]
MPRSGKVIFDGGGITTLRPNARVPRAGVRAGVGSGASTGEGGVDAESTVRGVMTI